MSHGAATTQDSPGIPTPSAVLEILTKAFGAEMVGETGYDISAARCCSEDEKAEARARGSSLLYGEMLPDGVTKALETNRLGKALESNSATVLELGMGSGKVALQIFLQSPGARRVMGVEVVPSRYGIGEVALQKLAATWPERFKIVSLSAGSSVVLEEVQAARILEFHCADFFRVGLDKVMDVDIIFFAVNIPCKLFSDLCRRLACAKDGARLFTYQPLEEIWWAEIPCTWRQCEVNVPLTDTFATSWSPQGYRFHVYVYDRKAPSLLEAGHRNETYSEWQVNNDAATGVPFFFNQETEKSQWDLPMRAGCWQVHWSEEHKAHFFCHWPSGHTQWEAPLCLASLGWKGSA